MAVVESFLALQNNRTEMIALIITTLDGFLPELKAVMNAAHEISHFTAVYGDLLNCTT